MRIAWLQQPWHVFFRGCRLITRVVPHTSGLAFHPVHSTEGVVQSRPLGECNAIDSQLLVSMVCRLFAIPISSPLTPPIPLPAVTLGVMPRGLDCQATFRRGPRPASGRSDGSRPTRTTSPTTRYSVSQSSSADHTAPHPIVGLSFTRILPFSSRVWCGLCPDTFRCLRSPSLRPPLVVA